uniref:Uncharacterized protein n=1 Tax=Opuntia streptacantha TaxID=393608 RepID=A0A7C8YMD5_OPUST
MVSMNPNSPEGFYVDAEGTTLPGLNPFSTSPAESPATAANTDAPSSATAADEFSNKKIRKPYTITKSRESWTEPEHDKFLEALQLFDRDWKKIEAFVGSKTVIQIRSHAQKYFLKVQKSGSNEHLPPPRPKRKAAHPYPQKASKSAPTLPQATSCSQSSLLLEPKFQRQDIASMPTNPNHNAAFSPRASNSQTVGMPIVSKGDVRTTGAPVANNCSSSTESTAMARKGEMNEPANHGPPLRVLPDFSQVYNFIGSVFDPDATDHLQKLKKMDPIDVETVLLLMRNLSVNLTSPAFEDHRRLLASYEIDSDKANANSMNHIVCGN